MAQETEREWLRPEGLAEARSDAGAHFAGGPHDPAGAYELRPLSLGEVLDRTFSLYRSRFWMFASISAVSASVQVIVQAISLSTTHALLRKIALGGPRSAPGLHPLRTLAGAQIGTWLAALVFFLVSAITQAATSLAMGEVYLSQPASARQALEAVAKRWYRWIGIALWQIGSMLWIPLLGLIPGGILVGLGTRQASVGLSAVGGVLIFVAVFGGFIAGFILYLRNTLAVPAATMERLTIRAAMRRSKVLAAGTKGRIFVVLLISGCLYGVVGVLESPMTLLILFAPKQEHTLVQAITLVVSFLGRTVVAPVALIGLTLMYFDQRVRKEAFDLQRMLEGSRGPGTSGWNTTAAEAAPAGASPLV